MTMLPSSPASVPKCSSTQFLRSSHSRIASKTPPKSAWLTRTWTRAILEGRQPGGFTAQKLVTYPDCRSAGRSSAKRSASSGRATRTMRLPPHEGRISFATPLHHWPRETMRRFRRPQPSESGLSRECADRHRRQSPAHGGVFPNPSSLDINPCKIRNLGGRRCGIRTRGTVAQIHRACAMFDDALGPEGRAELRTPRSNSRYAGVPIYLPEWDPFRIFSVRNRRERTREPQGGNGPTHRSIKTYGPPRRQAVSAS